MSADNLSILWSCEDGVGRLIINRPRRRNALDQQAYAVLAERLSMLDEDEDVRVVVVSGASDPARAPDDQAFCAGADRREMSGRALDPRPEIDDRLAGLELETPLIAAASGWCVGGGVGLLLLCDYRIATRSSRLQLPEVALDMVPAYGAVPRLVRAIGRGRAMDLLFRGETIDAALAYEWGLVNEVVDDDDLDTAAMSKARAIAASSKDSLRAVKKMVQAAEDLTLADAVSVERAMQALLASKVS